MKRKAQAPTLFSDMASEAEPLFGPPAAKKTPIGLPASAPCPKCGAETSLIGPTGKAFCLDCCHKFKVKRLPAAKDAAE